MIRKDIEPFLKKIEKPARYTGGEVGQIIKENAEVNVAFCFPDTYEIGMSNLGMKILYDVINRVDGVWCQRVFAPWTDMGKVMRENSIPLYALESGMAVADFDFAAFTLQYEGSYTNVLYMLELAGIPFYSAQRDDSFPIILGGGPCVCNAEPVADFFDIISFGEGEEALPELVKLYKENKHLTKKEFLKLAATTLEGFYVPSLYDVTYNDDGGICAIVPKEGAPKIIKKRIVEDFDKAPYPTKQVIPYIETVHDRAVIEVFRGCIRGCRFCQACNIYRPVRERSPHVLNAIAQETVKNSGYDEMSLSSLSISDYTCLRELTDSLVEWTDKARINLSLPSLRLDSFTKELMDKVMSVRKSGLTFAPEAGTQRMRDVINKGVTEEDLLRAAEWSFSTGRTNIKLYFMIGLPGETDEDIKGIADLAQKVVNLYYASPNKPKGKSVTVTISVACFVPKPFTPFQWCAQNTIEQLEEKIKKLAGFITTKKVNYTWHEPRVSHVEAILARGDRRLSKAIEIAYRNGQYFDSWSEHFSFDRWMDALNEAGLSGEFYANREISTDDILPWEHMDIGPKKSFFARELERAKAGIVTPDCRSRCAACGVEKCDIRDGRKGVKA